MAVVRCDKKCKVCGEIMHNVCSTRVYCDNCYRLRKNKQKRIARAKRKEMEEYNKKREQLLNKRKILSVKEIAKMASDEHLTYGAFVLKYGL